mgnify:FL=1
MTNNVKYPVQAFALAMITLGADLKTALLAGICVVFGDVLEAYVCDNMKGKVPAVVNGVMAAVGGVVLFGALFVNGYELAAIVAGAAVTAVGLYFSQIDRCAAFDEEEGVNFTNVVKNDMIAYVVMLVMACVREFLAGGTIFGAEVMKASFQSATFGKPMMGIIFTGIAVAIINKLLKADTPMQKVAVLGYATAIASPAFVLNNVPELVGTVIGAVMIMAIFASFRKKLNFSDTKSPFAGVPVELMTLGMVYMVFSIL